ncbi:MAG: c-type cytochrome [Gemmatimonadota bacterium]
MGPNLKVAAVVLVTIGVYTLVANMIPQVQSEVPQELNFAADATPEQLATAGEQLFNGAGGCTACHGLGTRAPNLITDEAGQGTIGARCAKRVPGEDCKAYLHRSLIEPSAYVVEGYQPIMPDARRTLSGAQIWALVAFLQSVGGEVTVTAQEVAQEEEQGAAAAGAASTAASGALAGGSNDPHELLQAAGCLACHRLGTEGQTIAPPFDSVGTRRTEAAIRRKILNPRADTTKGYESMAGVMPPNYGQQFNAQQLEALVTFLAGLK